MDAGAADAVSAAAAAVHGPCVWCVVNATSGNGRGRALLGPLVAAFAARWGAAAVAVFDAAAAFAAHEAALRAAAAANGGQENAAATATTPPLRAVVLLSSEAGGSVGLAEAIVGALQWRRQRASGAATSANSNGAAAAATATTAAAATEFVLVVGGDGTLSEVVNGLCRATLRALAEGGSGGGSGGAESPTRRWASALTHGLPPLLYLPAGTGADFARLGFSCPSVAAVMAVLSQPQSQHRRVDVGVVTFPRSGTRRFFINECSVGMSCDVIQRCEQLKRTWLRRLGGTAVFFVAAFIALVTLTPRALRLMRLPLHGPDVTEAFIDAEPVPANPNSNNNNSSAPPSPSPNGGGGGGSRVTCPSGKDGTRVRLTPSEIRADAEATHRWVAFPASTIAFCNGRYFGGGMCIAPHADACDQLLAVTAWYATFWSFFLRLVSVYNGRHIHWASTTTLEGGRFLVDAQRNAPPAWIELDGEIGEALPAVVELCGTVCFCSPLGRAAAAGGTAAAASSTTNGASLSAAPDATVAAGGTPTETDGLLLPRKSWR